MQDHYTNNPQFPAPLVPMITQQGIACSDDAGARLSMAPPGSMPAFAPVRQAERIDTAGNPSNAIYGDENPLEINFPIRSGERAPGGHDDGSHHDAWDTAHFTGGPWDYAPPGEQDVNKSWIQKTHS